MKDIENKISFTKDVEITDGKADTMHSALSNENEKCGGIGFESDRASVIIGHKKVASKSKRDSIKIISIYCHNCRFEFAILSFFKKSLFLMKKNNYLIC